MPFENEKICGLREREISHREFLSGRDRCFIRPNGELVEGHETSMVEWREEGPRESGTLPAEVPNPLIEVHPCRRSP